MAEAQLRIVRLSDRALGDGVRHATVEGVAVPVFSAAKTVVDAFRFRNKLGVDVASKRCATAGRSGSSASTSSGAMRRQAA